MSFLEAIVSAFSQYATFSGRARRSEYWYFVLMEMLASAAFGVLVEMPLFGRMFAAASGVFSLAILVPGLAVTWRRLHDTGHSGGCWFLIFIPLVGAIILLVWLCTEGTHGPNKYGPDPKGYYDEDPRRPPWEY